MSETDEKEKPLQRITELMICGERYELAANGKGHLVGKTGKDAYGNPIPQVVDIFQWIRRVAFHESGCFASANDELESKGEERRHTCSCPENPEGLMLEPSIYDVVNKIQSLLDHLVTAHRQLQTSRDARLGVGKEGKES